MVLQEKYYIIGLNHITGSTEITNYNQLRLFYMKYYEHNLTIQYSNFILN